MVAVGRGLSIYADRTSGEWIVRDGDGALWSVPAAPRGWEQRRPYVPSDEAELESVPGHYGYLLDLPVVAGCAAGRGDFA